MKENISGKRNYLELTDFTFMNWVENVSPFQ